MNVVSPNRMYLLKGTINMDLAVCNDFRLRPRLRLRVRRVSYSPFSYYYLRFLCRLLLATEAATLPFLLLLGTVRYTITRYSGDYPITRYRGCYTITNQVVQCPSFE